MTEPDEPIFSPPGLARERRLRRRPDFLRVQEHGSRIATKHFVFLLAAQAQPGPSRLGITVTRKVGCAVVRNRAKRLVRVSFRHLPSLLPQGIDLVVIVRSALVQLKAAEVLAEWQAVARLIHRRAQGLVPRGVGDKAC